MASFIQEDLDFLQARARIWLEAVVQEPLPSDQSLSAILADGHILSRVAAKIGQLVRSPSERGDGSGSRASGIPSPSRTATRWSCLANVEMFLKMCKDIGVPSRDLFSSTDVVQEKDIKRVCLCFRVLAKKARAANPSIPSFDDTSSMPVQIRSKGRVESVKKDLLESAAASEKCVTVDVDVSVGKVAIPQELLKEQVSNHETVDFGKRRGLPASTDTSGNKEARWNKDNEVAKAPFNDEKTRRGSLWAVIGFGVAFIIGSGTFLFSKRPRYQTYRVKEGDTLYDISKKTRVENWRKLHQSNPQLINPDLIFPEQTIRLKR